MSSAVCANCSAFFILLALPTALSQGQDPPAPTPTEGSPLFLPLASCAPFVQGTTQAPGQPCCNNLNQLSQHQPQCLCLMINDTDISTGFIINKTLALQLPSLCNLHLSSSTSSGPAALAGSPTSQVSLGANGTSTTAFSPAPTSDEVRTPKGRHIGSDTLIDDTGAAGGINDMKKLLMRSTTTLLAVAVVLGAILF